MAFSCEKTTCSHINEIIDDHEGTFICIDCGFVKDNFFHENRPKNDYVIKNPSDEIENILDQLNLPQNFSEEIRCNLTKKRAIVKNFNIKKLISEIYNTVNNKNSNLLLKDIINFSQLNSNQIKTRNISIINFDEIIEKYTKKFGIDFKTNTVIKEKISKYKNTGYQPLTIIGGVIYLYFLEIERKISMKKIANILGISSISIQRFLKFYNHNKK